MAWTPASSRATVSLPSGRARAFSLVLQTGCQKSSRSLAYPAHRPITRTSSCVKLNKLTNKSHPSVSASVLILEAQQFVRSGPLKKQAEPATKVSAPASAAIPIVSAETPPSTCSLISSPGASFHVSELTKFWHKSDMNFWPPNPGSTVITSTMSKCSRSSR